MNYFLIKLDFDTQIHIGSPDTAQSLYSSEDHFLADTLFSALCHTALQLYGEDGINQLCRWVKEGTFLLSDTMPWCGEEYYLPKPFIISDTHQELPATQVKAMKKLSWIPVRSFSAFSDSVHGGTPYDPEKHAVSFGIRTDVTRAKVVDGENAVPYQVGLFQFHEDCGLYILAGLETEQQEKMLISLITVLGMGGIGGKISSGYGKFHLSDTILLNEFFDDQTQWLYNALTKTTGCSLLLSSSLPREEEMEQALDGATFQIVRRSGFVASDTYSDNPLKKKTQYFLRAGSIFAKRFDGDLYTIGSKGRHPVYRYGRPLFLGVDF